MKDAEKDVEKAHARAHALLFKLKSGGCDNVQMLLAVCFIRRCQKKYWTLNPQLRGEAAAKFGAQFAELLLSGSGRGRYLRLMKAVDVLNNPQRNLKFRDRVLIAYVEVIERHWRLPLVREIEEAIESQGDKIPSERTIRNIVRKQLSLPLNPRGQPKKRNRK